MKGTVLTWEQLEQQDPKQTAVIVTYKAPSFERKRVLVGGWMSRDAAWYWCQDNGVRRYREEKGAVIDSFRLLRLSKVIKDLAERQPKDTSALKVA